MELSRQKCALTPILAKLRISTRSRYCETTGAGTDSGCVGAAAGGVRVVVAGRFTAACFTGAGFPFACAARFGGTAGGLLAARFFTTRLGAAASRASSAAAALALRTADHRLFWAAAIRLRDLALNGRLAPAGALTGADLPASLLRRSAMRASISSIFSW